jgi:hypothetical protein
LGPPRPLDLNMIFGDLYHFWLQAVELAVRAFGQVVSGKQAGGGSDLGGCRLVIAGGYDSRLAENREYLLELKDLAAELGLSEKVRPRTGPGLHPKKFRVG